MRFFVSGGAGFIGSNIVSKLVDEGHYVVAYDNLSTGRLSNLNQVLREKNFSFVKGDLLDKKMLQKVLKNGEFDTVIHLAANADVRVGIKNTHIDLDNGVIATHNLLEAMRSSNCSDIMFSSSSVVYGEAKVRPTPESYGPLLPISLYGAAKLAAEGMIAAYSELFGFSYAIYRFANVVGNRQSHGVVIDFIEKLKKNSRELVVLGDGRQRKSYIDVDDCIGAMLLAHKKKKNIVLNIASDGQTSVKFIAESLIKKMDSSARIRYTGESKGWPGDIANTLLSNKEMKKMGIKFRYPTSNEALLHAIDILIA